MSVKVNMSGGSKWQRFLKKKMEDMAKPHVRAGCFSNATHSEDHYTKSAPKKGEKKPRERKARTNLPKLVEILFWQEYGTKNGTPARAPLRKAYAKYKDDWCRDLGNMLKRGTTIDRALEELGKIMVADIQTTIKQGLDPALSERTLKIREVNNISGDTPLMASRELIKAIASEVVK